MRSRAEALVWAVWAGLAVVLLACIAVYTSNMPIAEDWLMVPALTGHEPHFWQWVWSQNNEHRIPLPRLMLLAILLPSQDFRAAMVFDVLVAAAVSAGVLLAVRRMRGGPLRITDACIPIVFLHLGNWENLLWAWQLCFVVATALSCVLLMALAGGDAFESRPRAASAAAAMALLPLCGANGLVTALPVAVFVLVEAFAHRTRDAAARVLLAAGAAAALAIAAVYFVGYQRATWYPPSPGLRYTLTTALRVTALGFGPGAAAAWNPLALATLAITAPAVLALCAAVVGARGDARWRALRLFAFLCGAGGVALAVGFGRAGLMSTVGLPARYVFLTLPILVFAYLAAEIHAGPTARRAVQTAMLVIAVVMLPRNVRAGLEWRDWYRAGVAAVERDIAAGAAPASIAERHQRFLMPWDRAKLARGLELLRASHRSPFTTNVSRYDPR